jgi:hypothetical protein
VLGNWASARTEPTGPAAGVQGSGLELGFTPLVQPSWRLTGGLVQAGRWRVRAAVLLSTSSELVKLRYFLAR